MATEQDLAAMFAKEGLTPERWSNGPGAVYAVHEHPYAKVLIVAQGEITFRMSGQAPPNDAGRDREVRMGPGDRLDLPAHTPHGAVVGPRGVVCWEAHR